MVHLVGLERFRTSETERSQEKSTPPTPLLGVRMLAWAADDLTGLIIADLLGTVGVAAHGGVDGSVAQFKRLRESSNQRLVLVVQYVTVHAVMVAALRRLRSSLEQQVTRQSTLATIFSRS